MSKTNKQAMCSTLLDLASGLVPLPDGLLFECAFADEHDCVRMKVVGPVVEIWEDIEDADSDGGEGDSGQATDSNNPIRDNGVFIVGFSCPG